MTEENEENRENGPRNAATDAWSKNWVVPILLLMLRQWSSYGYELMEKMATFGFTMMNPGTFYRTLRQMEKDGMVSSSWDISETGPARRVYSITATGESYLKYWAESLNQYQRMMDTFFQLYTGRSAQKESAQKERERHEERDEPRETPWPDPAQRQQKRAGD